MHWFIDVLLHGNAFAFTQWVLTRLLCGADCHMQTQLSNSDLPVLHGTNGPNPASHQNHAKKASQCAHYSNYRVNLTTAKSSIRSYLAHRINIPWSIFLCLFSIRSEHAKVSPSWQRHFQALQQRQGWEKKVISSHWSPISILWQFWTNLQCKAELKTFSGMLQPTRNSLWANRNWFWLQPSTHTPLAAAHRLHRSSDQLQCHWDFWIKIKSKNIFPLWEEKPVRPMFIRRPEGFNLLIGF